MLTEYKLVLGVEGGDKFNAQINELIKDGWQPQGGVSVVKGMPEKSNNPEMVQKGYDMQSKLFVFQAMVR